MNNKINNILDKYWKAETSLQEEAELRSYFASDNISDDHKEYLGLFNFISQNQFQEMELDTSFVLNSINDIDSLLTKYWDAETTLEEENILKSYFADNSIAPKHKELKSLFDYYKTTGQATTDFSFDIDEIYEDNHIDSLLSKYLNAETTLEEEKTLNTYFKSDSVKEDHVEFKSLFAFFDQASLMETDINIASVLNNTSEDINSLLEKYWNAETSLKEEEILQQYFAGSEVSSQHFEVRDLFFFYANQRNGGSNLDVEALLSNQKSNNGGAVTDEIGKPNASRAIVFNLRRLSVSIAAIFVLGFAAITVMNQSSAPETQYKGKYVSLDTEAEAQEAYEITKQAFALLSKNMNQGSKTVKKSVKKAENADIFK